LPLNEAALNIAAFRFKETNRSLAEWVNSFLIFAQSVVARHEAIEPGLRDSRLAIY